MNVGILLLDPLDAYTNDKHELPTRRFFDKELLLRLCRDQDVSVSANTRLHLPQSLKKVIKGYNGSDVSLSPKEIHDNAHLLIIVRSEEHLYEPTKRFRFDNFNLVVVQKEIELWLRN